MAKETSGLIMEYSSSYRKFNKTRKEVIRKITFRKTLTYGKYLNT